MEPKLKNCQYVFVSTNKLSKENEICDTAYGFAISGKDGIGMGHHLYILSDDEIQEGNKIMCIKEYGMATLHEVCTYDNIFAKKYLINWKKIIATTNYELHTKKNPIRGGLEDSYIKDVPPISKSDREFLISLYNDKKKNGVEKLSDETIIDLLTPLTPQSKGFYIEQRLFGAKWMQDKNAEKKFTLEDMIKCFYAGRFHECSEKENPNCMDYIESLTKEVLNKNIVKVEYENICIQTGMPCGFPCIGDCDEKSFKMPKIKDRTIVIVK